MENNRPLCYRLDENKVAHPVSATEVDWSSEATRVNKTDVNGVTVSTIFLVMDHNHFGEGPPLLFETMLFTMEGSVEEQWRCSTWEQAIAQHDKVVEMARLSFQKAIPESTLEDSVVENVVEVLADSVSEVSTDFGSGGEFDGGGSSGEW